MEMSKDCLVLIFYFTLVGDVTQRKEAKEKSSKKDKVRKSSCRMTKPFRED